MPEYWYACIVGSLKKARFERQDFTAFGTGAFGKNGDGIAVFQRFGYAGDFGRIAFDAAVARDVNRLRLCGEITDTGHLATSSLATKRPGKAPLTAIMSNHEIWLLISIWPRPSCGGVPESLQFHAAGSKHAQRP